VINLKIFFNNLRNPILKRKISKLFFCALEDKISQLNIETKNYTFEVDIKFISNIEIKKLNKEFREVDKETDVLSFPIIDFNSDKILNYNTLGDIVICKKIAKSQAKKYGHSSYREICFLALHGFLHLLGYDHIEKVDEEKMIAKANEILNKYKVKR
jgi:probable rRNA maturation factor